MEPETAQWLCTPDGERLIGTAVASARDSPTRVLHRRRRYPDLSFDLVAGAVAVAEARERLANRGFPEADRWMATPESAAQASSPGIARFHAARFSGAGFVHDVACGIGSDLVAFARHGLDIWAWEMDPARVIFARENANRFSKNSAIAIESGVAPSELPRGGALFFDPARRDVHGRASTDPARWSPPIVLWEQVRERSRTGVAKFSPGLPDDWLRGMGNSVLFLSENRECKEACVLHGDAAAGMPKFGACLIASGTIVAAQSPAPVAAQILHWLVDPDPAIARAGALGWLTERIGGGLISPDDIYCTTDRPPSPNDKELGTWWRVQEVLPLSTKQLGNCLRERGIGKLVLKKHRFPGAESEWLRKLAPKGLETAALALVHGSPDGVAVLCDPVPVASVE